MEIEKGIIVYGLMSNGEFALGGLVATPMTLKLWIIIEEVFMANKMRPIHPGEILKEEFLTPLGMSASQLARHLGVPVNRITQILHHTRSITGDTALRLSRFFKTSPELWMNLQAMYDLREAEEKISLNQINKIMPIILHKYH